MKKIILTGGAILLIAGSVVFGINATAETNNTCSNTEDCICCPCEPGCEPGDVNCTCPTECKK
jgi:hypothetical protein